MTEENTIKNDLNNDNHKLTKENGDSEPQNELEECKKKCDEYLNNWKRERADFLNYKKDEMERIGFLGKYLKEDIIFKILPILDNIYLAEKQLPENLKTKAKENSPEGSSSSLPQVEWTKGFLQIQNQITEFLKKEGIEEIKSIGEKFDPNCMEVVEEITLSAQTLANGKKVESGLVIEELQKGYKMNDLSALHAQAWQAGKVIRPAKVKVTK